ncbi:hypothetical protein [Formosa algae]|uniref:Uncharacterized protein n=1 Tax=Formosa algae TaxID=225843 RepID=A0A9X0YQU4_9FLAO|nr:hypothetical protein [Formosa algae]MBP1841313.1 hypothetical protein [Formosa algae]MDQ0336765.1 hypothetical protein [Formosa algae]OEI78807.1 hypothetical protein AST99_17695 [Formosa algae]
MKMTIKTLLATFAVCLFSLQYVSAQRNIKTRPVVHKTAAVGWVKLGTTHAKHTGDHDKINVPGPFDSYRKIKFKVKDAPVNMHRLVVNYEAGASQKVETRFTIPKNGESRVIDLVGGKRKLRSIEFWYDTKGILNGTADVTLYGLK